MFSGPHFKLSAGLLTLLLLTTVIASGWDKPGSDVPFAYRHRIRLHIKNVTPVERTEKVQLLHLEVTRHYGKIQSRDLELAKKHETQQFDILFPAAPNATIKVGDIIDYELVGYLDLGKPESKEN